MSSMHGNRIIALIAILERQAVRERFECGIRGVRRWRGIGSVGIVWMDEERSASFEGLRTADIKFRNLDSVEFCSHDDPPIRRMKMPYMLVEHAFIARCAAAAAAGC